ncbi:Zinc knuckle CX2CX4HX4C [Trema orientale]|uniref:Zinc knuckle CX2CX4HX4C n=1 Tax=Trema orientale TaxID=63057 RepID=A0A2P5EXG0_TREOI|nr:Zinc knuckle CX2CX4HX4C [Trema orientale]
MEVVSVMGSKMKARVRVDITKPLHRGIQVRVGDEMKKISLILQYERLPDSCFDCDLIGYKHLECPLNMDEETPLSFEKKKEIWNVAHSPFTNSSFSVYGEKNSVGGRGFERSSESL